MSGEYEEIYVLFRSGALHGELSVSNDLSAVHYDHSAVLVSHLSHSVYVGNVACNIGRSCYGNVLYLALVLLEHFFEVVVVHAAVVLDLRVDDLAALSPGQVVGVVLYAGCQDQIVRALHKGRSQLVEAVCGAVYVEAGVFFRIRVNEVQDCFAGILVDIRGVVGLLRKSAAYGAVHLHLLHYSVCYRLERRCGCSVIEVDQRLLGAIAELYRLVHAYYILADVVYGVDYLFRRGIRTLIRVLVRRRRNYVGVPGTVGIAGIIAVSGAPCQS